MPQFNEKTVYYYKTKESLPINIRYAGETERDPDFFIKRTDSAMYIFEYVTEGTGYIDYCGKTYKVSAGECFLVAAGLTYAYYSDKHDPYRKLWFCGDGPLIEGIYKAYFNESPVVVINGNFLNYWYEMLDFLKSYDGSAAGLGGLVPIFTRLMTAIYAAGGKTPERTDTPGRDERAVSLRNYIDAHLTEELSLDELSSSMYMNSVQLIRLFKREFGITPYRYYMEGRLEIAENLIRNTTLRICDIAGKVGFLDEYYFSYAFHKFKGYTPSSLRKITAIK